jgi:D-alanyl-lipoteichoic acid acyltransferase DltB (MBOAT superfamily)
LSCGFIATYSYKLLLYVLGYTLINYYIGILLPDAKRKKTLFIGGIVINVTQLILLKYVSFTIGPLFETPQYLMGCIRFFEDHHPCGRVLFHSAGNRIPHEYQPGLGKA